jgi:hypothetical protein
MSTGQPGSRVTSPRRSSLLASVVLRVKSFQKFSDAGGEKGPINSTREPQ